MSISTRATVLTTSLALVCALASVGCATDEEIVSSVDAELIGKAQKGPYLAGSTFTAFELSSDLAQSGRSFTGTFTGDDGSWHVRIIGDFLLSDYLLMTARGAHVHELTGQATPDKLDLEAYIRLDENVDYRVNVFTHIAKDRIETLVAQDVDFDEAYDKAMLELNNSFKTGKNIDFGTIDLFEDHPDSAQALYLSCVILKNRTNTELSTHLQGLRNDLADDGVITLTNQLLDDARFVDYLQHSYRTNLASYNITNLSQAFTSQYDDLIAGSGYTPRDPIQYPTSGDDGPNILAIANGGTAQYGQDYSFRAIIPDGVTMKIVTSVASGSLPSGFVAIGGALGGGEDWHFDSSQSAQISPYSPPDIAAI